MRDFGPDAEHPWDVFEAYGNIGAAVDPWSTGANGLGAVTK